MFTNRGGLITHQPYCLLNPSRVKRPKSPNAHARKGSISWNKGLSKDTDDRVRRLSEKRKGRKLNTPGKSLDPIKEQERKQKIRESALARNLGGYVKGSGRGKKGWYKGFFCDSSWELAYVIYCLDHEVNIQRNTIRKQYEWQGQHKNYLPDFIIDGQLIEIKGYKSEQWQAKITSNPDVTVLYEQDLKHIFEYVINKYGKDFINMYEQL